MIFMFCQKRIKESKRYKRVTFRYVSHFPFRLIIHIPAYMQVCVENSISWVIERARV